jgi:hypothetical protein
VKRPAAVLILLLLVALGTPPTAAGASDSAADARAVAPAARPGARVVQSFDEARVARARKWPGRRITYVDRTLDADAVKQAVRVWNTSGIKMRFKKISSKRRADLVIKNSRKVPSGCGTGVASLGYTGRRQAYVRILHGTDADGQSCAWPGQTLVLIHELGHVLGLQHDDSRCSVMNSYHVNGVAPGQCFTPDTDDFDERPGRWWCGGLVRKDIQRARKMYGGKVHVPATPWCDIVPVMPATGPVTAVATGGGGVQVTLHHEPEPALPTWLSGSGHAQSPFYEVHVTPGACSAVAGDVGTIHVRRPWTAAPGTPETVDTFGDAGVQCVTAWAIDPLGRYAAVPSTSLVTVS